MLVNIFFDVHLASVWLGFQGSFYFFSEKFYKEISNIMLISKNVSRPYINPEAFAENNQWLEPTALLINITTYTGGSMIN